MATALDIVSRAMRLIGALAEGEVSSAAQAADGITALQAMLGEWETRGVRLGDAVDATYSTSTTIPVPVTHLNALALNLAVLIAPEYGRADALQAIIPQAERSFDALVAQYHKVPRVALDPALVVQSGLINGTAINPGGAPAEYGPLFADSDALYP